MGKAYFISDVHLGLESPERERAKEDRLLAFLASVAIDGTQLSIVVQPVPPAGCIDGDRREVTGWGRRISFPMSTWGSNPPNASARRKTASSPFWPRSRSTERSSPSWCSRYRQPVALTVTVGK